MSHAISWFEIPTLELTRATDFYAAITGHALARTDFYGTPMVVFPGAPEEVRGCLVQSERQVPGGGQRIYLACDHLPGRLDGVLARVAPAGGEVVLPRTDIGRAGIMALIKDSEGNVVGLHEEAA